MKQFVVLVLFTLILQTQALVKILSGPESVVGTEFTGDIESKLNLYPRTFSITGRLVLADPDTACKPIKNTDLVNGNIVIITEGGSCAPSKKQKHIYDAGGIGMILVSVKIGKGGFGYLYYFGGPPGDTVLPSVNIKEAETILEILKDPSVFITVSMDSTDHNPWLELGQGPVGILFQIYFEIFAFVIFCVATYKLTINIYFKGFQFNVTQICLSLEIMAALLRMIWMIQPLSWYNFLWSPLADSLVLSYSVDLSLMTDLLITFYWQEILMKCDRSLSNKVLNNLDKLKIPYVVVISIIWILDTIGALGRARYLGNEGASAFLISSIINTIVIAFIAIFYLVTSVKILKLTRSTLNANKKTRRVSRLMIIVMFSGLFLLICVLGPILYISPVGQIGPKVMVGLWWFWYTGVWGSSLTKVVMFETPRSPFSTSDSDLSDSSKQLALTATTSTTSSESI